MNLDYLLALLGGILIGTSVTLLLALNGKILGVSGIVGGLIDHKAKDHSWRWSLLMGFLLAGILTFAWNPALFAASPASTPWVVIAGLLVGFGTRLGNGCTSGHGVCGISRLSVRSIAATLTFILAGIVTVWIIHNNGGL